MELSQIDKELEPGLLFWRFVPYEKTMGNLSWIGGRIWVGLFVSVFELQ